jgi:precorrin-2 dehydrogenase / sirohydrochlorin ferrochelatase
MLPITIDAARVRIVLVGGGEAARRRLQLLDAAGATRVVVYADKPAPDLAAAAGGRLRRRLPTAEEIARAQLVFLASVAEPAAARLRRVADAAGVLVNVEDDIARSDFHSPAVVRRGDLTVAISTGGKSPALAGAIRRQIEASFGPEWEERLESIALLRKNWRNARHDGAMIARFTTIWFDRHGGFALKTDQV